jgi:hypothetical protein
MCRTFEALPNVCRTLEKRTFGTSKSGLIKEMRNVAEPAEPFQERPYMRERNSSCIHAHAVLSPYHNVRHVRHVRQGTVRRRLLSFPLVEVQL